MCNLCNCKYKFNFDFFIIQYYLIKRVSLFNFSFKIRLENQSASLPYSGVRPARWQHRQNIYFQAEVRGLNVLPPLGSWVIDASDDDYTHSCTMPVSTRFGPVPVSEAVPPMLAA